MGAQHSHRVIAVIVTYADRRALVNSVLQTLPEQGVTSVVVVDNGAVWPVREELAAKYGDFVDVIDLGRNTGSAVGFASGIQHALDLGADYIWLLDDDNRPCGHALTKLRDAMAEVAADTPHDRLAVLAFRPEHQADVAAGVPSHRINPRPDSFRGFHILDIPYKIWRRTPWGRPRVRGQLPATVVLEQAPYSGLLFHRDLISRIGLPNAAFVLYADDTEFSYRVTEIGGQIRLVTSAVLDDLESSWNTKARFRNGFAGMLRGAGDFRAYYGMRNGAHFDDTHLKRNPFVFWLNRTVYMRLLSLFSVALGQRRRYQLLREAVRDGLSGRLGVNRNFPL